MKIIVGLGNPEEKYKLTRHNVGFMTIDALAERQNLTWQNNKKFGALVCKNNDILYVKPQTFMNNSGRVVATIMSYYQLLPKKLGLLKIKDSNLSKILTIIHDDIDIELGKFKISVDSRSAGHKGIESIINYLKTKNFKRIRIGVKTEMAEKMPTDKFVLQKFSQEEIKTIKNLFSIIAEQV